MVRTAALDVSPSIAFIVEDVFYDAVGFAELVDSFLSDTPFGATPV